MKIYRVIFTSIKELEYTVMIETFFNRENALKYYKEQLYDLKKQQEELDMEDYCIDEDETSYERYLNGRAIEDTVFIWLEEDNTYDELDINKQAKMRNEKDNDYEMQ